MVNHPAHWVSSRRSLSVWATTSLWQLPGLDYGCTCPFPHPVPGSRLPRGGRGSTGESVGASPALAQWTSAAQWMSAVSCSCYKAVLSQLQALSIPGPATMLYCLFPSAGRCRCNTCGCLELLALGIRDERPVTPRFMGQVWEASVLGRFCILWAIFLCLIPIPATHLPNSFPLSS